MTNTVDLIREALEKKLQPTKLHVFDDRAEHIGHAHQDSGHFTVEIESPVFSGKNTIEKHKMVYAALAELMTTRIHALIIKV